MKRLNKKKGFTIVELVIVIAVVGVLTAVLVPTFVNLANRAKEAENQTFVRNINTQLAVEEADPSVGRYERVSDAIKSAQRMGFDVTKLTPVDGNDIVWDSAANRFAIVKPAYATNPVKENVVYSDGGIKATEIHEIWKMYRESEMPSFANQTYSIYAKGQWNATEVTVKTGFDDAGQGIKVTLQKEESTSSLLWSKAGDRLSKENEVGKTFVIENSSLGDIVIDYPGAKVIHYGDSGYQTFNALSQYDERGSYRTRDNKSANSVVSDAKATGTGTNNILAEGIQVTASKEHQTAFVLGEGVTGGFTVNGQEKTSDVAIDGEGLAEITKVSNATQLADALSAKAEYVMFENDIASNQTAVIDYSMTLDGDGHKLTTTTGQSGVTSSKSVNLIAPNIDVTLRNLTTVENNDLEYGRGLQLEESGINLLVEKCEINAKHYAINFWGGSEEEGSNNCNVTIKESAINGWGALNIWSHGLKLYAYDSTFDGYNDKVYNDAGWNGFGTIVLEGDTTSATDKHAENCEVVFNNCKISSASDNGNKQTPVLFNLYSKGNVVKLFNTEFTYPRADVAFTDNGIDNGFVCDEYSYKNIEDVIVGSSKDLIVENGLYCVSEPKYVEINGGKATWAVALAMAKKGDTIKLTHDLDHPIFITNGKSIVLDLNGHKITNDSTNTDTLNVYETGSVVICDTSLNKGGQIVSNDGSAIWSGYSEKNIDKSSITIQSGVALVGKTNAIAVDGGQVTVVIESGATLTGEIQVSSGTNLIDNR